MSVVTDGVRVSDDCEAVVVRGPRKLPRPRFAIFYADGSVVEDDGEEVEIAFKVPRAWRDAPRDGVQFVVCRRDDGKLQVLHAHDIYLSMPLTGDIMATNDLGAMMRWLGLAKYGLWIPDSEFRAIQEKANEYRREQAEKDKAR